MAHCPGCGNTVSSARDITFTEMDADGTFSLSNPGSANKYYVMSCGQCNRMLGGGVASNKTIEST